MMRPEDVAEHLTQRPFEPFRIFMSDGKTFDIRHRELCMVGGTTAYVGIPDRKLRGVAMQVVHCALVHMTRIEPLNGRRPRAARKRSSE